MKTSQAGIDLIKKFEGCSLRAYKPVRSEQHFTIGYGHYSASVKEGQVITQAKAEELLIGDLKRFEDGVNKYVTVDLNQNQFDALVSFSYNLGLGSLSSSTLLKHVNKKEFTKAAEEFERWVKAGGNVLAGLVKRRKAERELFLKADQVQPKPIKTPKPHYVKTGSFPDKESAEAFAKELKSKFNIIVHVMEVGK